jgi:endogenous inhibitor of DNA gyrase (YacG/DUF329 family)
VKSAARIVPCPTCKGPSVYGPANPHRPFCSARCRGVDLGAWASDSYRVAAPSDDADDDGSSDGAAGSPPAAH